jgi:flavin-binding protein dodecin
MAASPMDSGHTYKVTELVGTSSSSVDDAINSAVGQAAKSLRHLRWFEVTQLRGDIKDGRVAHYQVTLKLGFTLEA